MLFYLFKSASWRKINRSESNERSIRMRVVSINSSRSESDMDVDAPKSLNNIENSKIRAVQYPIQEEKKSEISDEDHFQNKDQQ